MPARRSVSTPCRHSPVKLDADEAVGAGGDVEQPRRASETAREWFLELDEHAALDQRRHRPGEGRRRHAELHGQLAPGQRSADEHLEGEVARQPVQHRPGPLSLLQLGHPVSVPARIRRSFLAT